MSCRRRVICKKTPQRLSCFLTKRVVSSLQTCRRSAESGNRCPSGITCRTRPTWFRTWRSPWSPATPLCSQALSRYRSHLTGMLLQTPGVAGRGELCTWADKTNRGPGMLIGVHFQSLLWIEYIVTEAGSMDRPHIAITCIGPFSLKTRVHKSLGCIMGFLKTLDFPLMTNECVCVCVCF